MVEFAPKIDREDHQLGINSKLSTPEQLFLRGGDATEKFFCRIFESKSYLALLRNVPDA